MRDLSSYTRAPLCVVGGSDDSVKILSVSVTPDPPEKGQQVSADVKLEFSKCVAQREELAYFPLSSAHAKIAGAKLRKSLY